VLVVGVPDSDDNVVLVRPDKGVPIGGRLYWSIEHKIEGGASNYMSKNI
jgi:hypothetical protein